MPAHNLIRWTIILGEPQRCEQLIVARTVRVQFIAIAARLVNRAGRLTLRGPTDWPWAGDLTAILDTLRALEPATG